jgi:hypothetical protein
MALISGLDASFDGKEYGRKQGKVVARKFVLKTMSVTSEFSTGVTPVTICKLFHMIQTK